MFTQFSNLSLMLPRNVMQLLKYCFSPSALWPNDTHSLKDGQQQTGCLQTYIPAYIPTCIHTFIPTHEHTHIHAHNIFCICMVFDWRGGAAPPFLYHPLFLLTSKGIFYVFFPWDSRLINR